MTLVGRNVDPDFFLLKKLPFFRLDNFLMSDSSKNTDPQYWTKIDQLYSYNIYHEFLQVDSFFNVKLKYL